MCVTNLPTAVLGDLHLGRVLYGMDMTPEIRRIMWQFLSFCIQHGVSKAIQLGDVFDTPTPSEVHRKLLVQWLNEFERAKICLVVLTGNHDVMGRRGAVSALESIRVMNKWNYVRIVDRPLFEFGHLYLPFPSPAIWESDQEWMEEVLWVADSINWPTTIFCHLNIEGARMGAQEWAYRGEDKVLPPGVYRDKGVDAVFAGHIHKPQRIGKDKVYVVGAASRLRFDEADEDRIFALRTEDSLKFVRVPGQVLRTIELDASGASYGGDPPSTDELKSSFSHMDVKDALVKVAPVVDDTSFVSWREIESELYGMGAKHVAMAPPVRVRVKEKRRRRKVGEKLTHEGHAKSFLRNKVQDKGERRAIWKMYQELKER